MTVTFSSQDLAQIEGMGKEESAVRQQIEIFAKGIPATALTRACTVNDGIVQLNESQLQELSQTFDGAKAEGRVTKFVPASGAASRMFKALHGAREQLHNGETPEGAAIDQFKAELDNFAFIGEVREHLEAQGKSTDDLKAVLDVLLGEEAMGYGNKPKGLLRFHSYDGFVRTPVEEHLSEALAYATDSHGVGRIHFTVSPEHMDGFKSHVAEAMPAFEKLGLKAEITYSIQKKSTDTIAVTPENEPFRVDDDKLFFRPGGHGALISNVDDLKGDILFIKNIDNVVPDHLKEPTITYKKALGGLLVQIQNQIFTYLRRLDEGPADDALVDEILSFAVQNMGLSLNTSALGTDASGRGEALHRLLNRPVRICGMVKNEGEPGGGPFWVDGRDGMAIQIVESSQIDTGNEEQAAILSGATHFNPVDLVCGVRDYHGNAFDLSQFIDHDACFLSEKSLHGRPLKALELPGLWNGAMAYWNTCFVEVPLETFNPVKTVNDLLRDQHQ